METHTLTQDRDALVKRGWISFPYHWTKPIIFVLDLFIVVSASVLVGTAYHHFVLKEAGDVVLFASVGGLIQIYVGMVLAVRGDYEVSRLATFSLQLREITAVWTAVFFLFFGLLFALKISDALSRATTLIFCVAGLAAIIGWRGFVAHYLATAIASGRFAERRVVVLGEHEQIATSGILYEMRRFGYRPLQVFAVKEMPVGSAAMPETVSSAVEQMIAMARDPDKRVDELLLVFGPGRTVQIDAILAALRILSIPVRLIPDQLTSRLLDRPVSQLGRIWTAEVQRGPLTVNEQAIKRVFDIAVASTGLVMLSPLMLVMAALIKLDSSGPVLFKQTRNGFNGRAFRIYKFRSMRVLEDGNVIKQAQRNDSRVTRIGRFMRRTSIDELPQLINVLRGEMSIIGPRPHAVAHNNEYERLIARYAFRHKVKPGLTGWAQVQGYRGETATLNHMVKRVECDIWYIDHWSLTLDIKIMLRTVFVALLSPAAY